MYSCPLWALDWWINKYNINGCESILISYSDGTVLNATSFHEKYITYPNDIYQVPSSLSLNQWICLLSQSNYLIVKNFTEDRSSCKSVYDVLISRDFDIQFWLLVSFPSNMKKAAICLSLYTFIMTCKSTICIPLPLLLCIFLNPQDNQRYFIILD
jgi:hypothetical protein